MSAALAMHTRLLVYSSRRPCSGSALEPGGGVSYRRGTGILVRLITSRANGAYARSCVCEHTQTVPLGVATYAHTVMQACVIAYRPQPGTVRA